MADPIEIEIFKSVFHSIAEEMGAALRRTAFSPNIKERRDYSCAVFDGSGQVVAMGDHMPVHLGSMPRSVQAAIEGVELGPADIAMLNDPFSGGTHLPDITLVMPVYLNEGGVPSGSTRLRARGREVRNRRYGSRWHPHFYVACRAHHADIGGTYPGSMGLAREIYQEGLRIPPVKLVRGGRIDRDILAMVLSNVRTPREREGDLGAQIAACNTGTRRLREICGRYGQKRVARAASELLDYSDRMMRALLLQVPAGVYRAEDFLDDDGVGDKPIQIAVTFTFHDAGPARRPSGSKRGGHLSRLVTVDFTSSAPQVEGGINAVEAITWSAVFYVFRSLVAEDVPATAGLMRAVEVIAPEGTVVNARPPAAVAGGNVETSQRIVDVLLRALATALGDRIPAAASGTMNNLTIGGIDPRTGEPFAYYETVAGGMGATPNRDGVSGIHTHMTNSLNTPAEALEYAYPLRVRGYSLRRESGGKGRFRGGDGIVRELEVLTDAEVTILSDRRMTRPWGLAGGADGAAGRTIVQRHDGSEQVLRSKDHARLAVGERVRIESPGGGGYGRSEM